MPTKELPDRVDENVWFDIVAYINHEVRQFRQYLSSVPNANSRPRYISDWNQYFTDVVDHLSTHPDASWRDITRYLTDEVMQDFRHFVETMITSVRPMTARIQIWNCAGRPPRDEFAIQLTAEEDENEVTWQMYKLHLEEIESDTKIQQSIVAEIERNKDHDEDVVNESIASSLQQMEKDMDEKLSNATKELKSDIANIQASMSTSIADAIRLAFGDAKQDAIELKQTINDAKDEINNVTNTISSAIEKARGDADIIEKRIDSANEHLDRLRTEASTIRVMAEGASEKAKKIFLEAKTDIEKTRDSIRDECRETLDKVGEKLSEADLKLEQVYKKIRKTKRSGTGGDDGDDGDSDSSIGTSDDGKPRKGSSSYPRYGGGDYHYINAVQYQVKGKKFIEDETDLTCMGESHFLIFYNLFRNIALQYGILITQLRDIEQWDKDVYDTNPICPYDKRDFSTDENFLKCYNAMSMAIANKLKKVSFDDTYAAADLVINEFNNDGYDMLWKLMQQAHPDLKRDKSNKPKVPLFEGNFPEYIHKYKSYLCYNENRKRPIIYDEDEIANDIINGIKRSQYYETLRKGIKEADDKLDTWRNSGAGTAFPDDLKLDNIANTILLYYMERNENPLRDMRGRGRSRQEDEDRRRQDFDRRQQQDRDRNIRRNHDRHNPAIRAAYYDRGNSYQSQSRRGGSYNRSRNNSYDRMQRPSTSRSPSYGRRNNNNNNSRDRSRSTSSQRDRLGNTPLCEICGSRHLPSTIGCPNFIQYMNIRDHVDRGNPDDLRRQLQDMERERSRSRPPVRPRSYSRESRQRSTSNDRGGGRGDYN